MNFYDINGVELKIGQEVAWINWSRYPKHERKVKIGTLIKVTHRLEYIYWGPKKGQTREMSSFLLIGTDDKYGYQIASACRNPKRLGVIDHNKEATIDKLAHLDDRPLTTPKE